LTKRSQLRLVSQVPIEGFDEALREKLQPRQNILLLGSPFSGKTTLAIQFLASGLKSGERGIFVTTKDTPDGIRAKAEAFGWNLREYEGRGELRYIDCYSQVVGLPSEESPEVFRAGISEEHFERISLIISSIISDSWREGGKVRLAFDSLSTLFYYSDLISIARFLHILLGRLKAVNATSLFILESGMHDEQVITVMRSLCDGVLQLSSDGENRYIQGILSAGALSRLRVEMSKQGLRAAIPQTHRSR